ncbi:MAG: GAF domain-containing protein [Chloroflexota bacterium]
MTKEVLASPSHRPALWNSSIRQLIWSQDQLSLVLVLFLLALVFSLQSSSFRRLDNFMLIALEASTIGIVAAGQTLVLLTGGIDLSVGAIAALAGVVAAALMKQGIGPIPPVHPFLAIVVALLVGALIGLGHGLLITKRSMPPFIVTLGSLSVLRGAALVGTNASPIHDLPDGFKWISDGYLGPVPAPALTMLAIFLILGYILRNTKLGRYAYAIGGNPTAARLSGVPVDTYQTYVYMLSGFLSALAGIILIARIDSAIYTNGEGYELSSVAAVIIGGTSLNGGVGGVWGTLLGVLIMAVVRNGLVMLGISFWWHSMVIGGIILLAVLIDVERRKAKQATAPIQVNQVSNDYSYLDEMIAKILQLVKDRFGSPYARLYLVDRDLDDLQECRTEGQITVPAGSLADQVRKTGQPIVLDNLTHQPNNGLKPLNHNIQSALAIPLTSNGQLIGVLEVQSSVPHCFNLDSARRLAVLVQEVTTPLEDAWLLERGWLARQTRQVLRHLWDETHLGQVPLAEWAFPGLDFSIEGGPAARGRQLRGLLMETIKELRPESDFGGPRPTRRYDILRLTYVEGRTVDEVIQLLNVSRRQYFYDLKDALDTLAHRLVSARQLEH